MNPSDPWQCPVAKPRPVIPDPLYDVKENEVYDGLAYLVVAKKR